MKNEKFIVGRAEWLSLSNLSIPLIKARVDSGAKTSSLHAFNIHTLNRSGETWVEFDIHPIQRNRKFSVHCEAKVVDRRTIKSSNGESEKRYVIRTPMRIGEYEYAIEVTLTNRDNMGHRMLLGREAMNGKILIDPSLEFIHGDYNAGDLKERYST